MASPTESANNTNYVDFQEYVDFQLRKARQQIRMTDLLTAGTVAAVLAVGYLLAFVVADQWLFASGLPTAVRWTGLVLWVSLLTLWIGFRLAVPLLRSVTGLFAAKEVERSEPELRSNLLNWVDLQSSGRTVDPAVLRAIERRAAVQLSKIDVAQAIDHRPLLRSGYALVAVVLLFCMYALFSPKQIAPSLARVLPFSDVAAPTRTEIRDVKPGDTRVLAGSTPEVIVDLAGAIPEKVTLLYTTADHKFRDEAVTLQPDGVAGTRFRTTLVGESGRGVRQDLTFHIVAGDAISRDYRIAVDLPPSARVNEVVITPPPYTKLPVEKVVGGNIAGWEGSTVSLTAAVNMPVKTAVIEFLDEPQGKPTGEEVAAEIHNGLEVVATWPLEFRSDGTFAHHYRVQCRTEAGREDPSPLVYEISIRRDQPPEIVLLAPERDLEVPANAVIPLLAEARDPDFELGPITLEIQQAGKTIARDTLSQGLQPALRLQHDLALKPLGLKPGQEVVFWLAAQDNRQPRRNRKQTPPLKIRITEPVTEQQAREQLAEEKSRQQDQLAELDHNANPPEMTPEDQGADAADNGVREQPATPMPEEGSPREQPPQAEPTEGDSGKGTGQNSTNAGKQTDPGQSAGKSAGDSKSADAQEEPLSSEGEDDQQVLERLIQQLKSKDQPAGSQTGKQGQPPQGNQQQNSQNESAQKPDGQTPPESSATNDTPKTPQPGKQSDPKQPRADGMPEKPSPQSTSPQKERSDASGQPSSDKNSEQPKPGGNTPGQPQPSPGVESPMPQTPQETGTPPASESNSMPDPKGTNSRNTDKPDVGPKSPMPQPATNKDKPDMPGDAAMPDAQQSPDSPNRQPAPMSENNKSGDNNKSSDKNAGDNKQPGDQPQAGQGSPLPQDQGQTDKPANNSQDSGKSETSQTAGKGKPKDTDAGGNGAKPTSPKDGNPPPSRPGDLPEETPAMPQEGTGDDKMKGKEPRDGAPQAGDESPKGNGRKNGQRSEQPQTGENGGSAQSQEGSSGSQQRGPGESTGKPGEQERGKSSDPAGKSSKSSQGGSPSQSGQGQKSGGESGSNTPSGESSNASPMPGSKDDSQPGGTEKPGDKTGKEDPSQPGKMNDSATKEGAGSQANQKPGDQSSSGQKPGDQAAGGQQPGGQKSGEGASKESSPMPAAGDQKTGDKESAQSGSGKAEGSQNQKSDNSKSGDSSKQGQQGQQGGGEESGGQQAGGKPGAGKPGGSGSDPSGSASEGGGGSSGGNSSPQSPVGQGGGGSGNASSMSGQAADDPAGNQAEPKASSETGSTSPEGEAANLEYKKQAAELVLQRLKQGLDRGDVDQQLLDELGWTPDQLKQFVKRLDAALQASQSTPETPVEQARREQFEEMLKALSLDRKGTKRSGKDQPTREVDETNSRRTPVPLEYRQAWERYTKSLSKSPQPASKK